MATSCRDNTGTYLRKAHPLLLAVLLALVAGGKADAFSFGHARLVSAAAEPLRIQVPLNKLSPQEIDTLSVRLAPQSRWQEAGLTPPTPLNTLSVQLQPGLKPDSRLVVVESSQVLQTNTADLLLNVETASGQQPYQVSVLASYAPEQVVTVTSSAPEQPQTINVVYGDTLWALAQRHNVAGSTIFQMLYALHQANPHAFANGNINRLKAGVRLQLPSQEALQQISRQQAQQFFQQQMQAFHGAQATAEGATQAAQTAASAAAQAAATPAPQPATKPQAQAAPEPHTGALDATATPPAPEAASPKSEQGRLLLSSAQAESTSNASQSGTSTAASATSDTRASKPSDSSADSAMAKSVQADDALATQKNIQETDERLSQLERNVKSVNEALQSQGTAAKDALVEGAHSISQAIAELTGSESAPSTPDHTGEEPPINNQASDSAQVQLGSADAQKPTDHISTLQRAQPAVGTSESDTPSPQAAATSGAETSEAGRVAAAAEPTAAATDTAAASSTGPASAERTKAASESAGTERTSPAITSETQPSSAVTSQPSTTKMLSQNNWLQDNLLAVLSGLLALIVIIVAWVLRRATVGDKSQQQPPITEAMVQEQLEKINLELGESDPNPKPDQPQS